MFRCSGVQGFRGSGVQGSGVQGFRCLGVQGREANLDETVFG